MDTRKRIILKAITVDYISTAEPVGSRTIARRYQLGVSPATIRNEMADLEESGYIEQLHTSSGRIPSDKGYRFYVDALMDNKGLSSIDEQFIRQKFEEKRQEIEDIIQQTARVLSDMTGCVSVVLGPVHGARVLKHIELVPLSDDSVIVVTVTSPGVVETRTIQLDNPIKHEEIERISRFLNQRLRGLSLSELKATFIKDLTSEIAEYTSLFEGAVEQLIQTLNSRKKERIFTDGTMKILDQPEFKEIEKVKSVLSILGQEQEMLDVLEKAAKPSGLSVVIGRENSKDEIRDCSVICANYSAGQSTVGAVGVIGPTRMDYDRITTIVEFISKILSETLTRNNIR